MNSRSYRWLLLAFAVGAALVFLYPDADQQDAGYHYLFARWSWIEPQYLVSVWARPLFTLAYAVPSLGGYPLAKFFTLLIALATAWQSARFASDLGIQNAELAIPLIFLQPAFFLVCSVTLTEPLFALILVLALRLDLRGFKTWAAVLVSLLILVRPEGFFVGLAWGFWVLFGRSHEEPLYPRLARASLLSGGAAAWWAVTTVASGDPLWLVHNWPPDWKPVNESNIRGQFWWYFAILPLIVGPLFLPQFFSGLVSLWRSRRATAGLLILAVIFLVHAAMFSRGWFGDAGYPRYLVCVAPVTALATLEGWNRFRLAQKHVLSVLLLLLSFGVCLSYVDGYRFTRDSRAIDDVLKAVDLSRVSYQKLIFSQSYSCIRLGCTPSQWFALSSSKAENIERLQKASEPTLVIWDNDVGPKWYGLTHDDFKMLGFTTVAERDYIIPGWFLQLPWKRHGGPRVQGMHILYRNATSEAKRP